MQVGFGQGRTVMATTSLRKLKQVEYPTSDGKPMAETDYRYFFMVALRQITG
jgi:hypothetical protein